MGATKKKVREKFTDEQRAQWRQAQREEAQQKLAAAVESLQSSDGFRAWLKARARFHNYSYQNTLLILVQCPEATRVAAASAWRDLGRHPVKGSKALRIFAPIEWRIPCSESDPGAIWNSKRERWERKVRSFKLVPVFDLSQTDGEPLAPAPEVADVEGETHAHLEPKLLALAEELGYSVRTESLGGGMGGYCDLAAKQIVLAEGHSPNARVRVLVHELCHAQGIDYKDYSRSEAETIVEAATFIVLAGQGLDVDASSVPYIAGWSGQDGHAKLSKFAETIDRVARRIEKVLPDAC